MRSLKIALVTISSMFTAAAAQTAADMSVDACWRLDTGTGAESAVLTPGSAADGFITSTAMTVGSGLSVRSESGDSPVAHTYDGYTQTFFRAGSKTSTPSDDNAITFLLNTGQGITFTPTGAGLKIARWLTDKCKVDVCWIDDEGHATPLASGIMPNRNYNPDKGFYEYRTLDEQGNVISPESNVLTFTASGSLTYETILTDLQAAAYDLAAVYPD